MTPADTICEGMDQDTQMQGMLLVGRDSSQATDNSEGWVRPPSNIPVLMNAPYETPDSVLQVSRISGSSQEMSLSL